MFDLKSDGICGKITESQRGMFLHNNTSRLNDFFVDGGGKEGLVSAALLFMNQISLLQILNF